MDIAVRVAKHARNTPRCMAPLSDLNAAFVVSPGNSVSVAASRSKSVSRAVSAKRVREESSMRDEAQVEKAKKLKKIHQRELIRAVCGLVLLSSVFISFHAFSFPP